MVTIQQIYQYLDRVAPFDSQEDFDNAGFLVGDQNEIGRASCRERVLRLV